MQHRVDAGSYRLPRTAFLDGPIDRIRNTANGCRGDLRTVQQRNAETTVAAGIESEKKIICRGSGPVLFRIVTVFQCRCKVPAILGVKRTGDKIVGRLINSRRLLSDPTGRKGRPLPRHVAIRRSRMPQYDVFFVLDYV
jgi:hypothetical protein